MARNRKKRDKTFANVAYDENELNKCRAQGMLAGSLSMGVGLVILMLTTTTKVPSVQIPLWAIFPIAIPAMGLVLMGFGVGAFVGREIGRHIIYPTRIGNHNHAMMATGVLFAIGLGLLVGGLALLGFLTTLWVPE